MKVSTLKNVYFLGIGGIGMSALARYMQANKIKVYGYDKTATKLTKSLEKSGMKIHYHEDVNLIPTDLDLIVYTPAIPDSNQEKKYLLKSGIPFKKRAEVLGWVSNEKKILAVAGTHGKTSTCAILTHILKTGGVDCNAFLGGIATNYKSNFIAGKSSVVVVEADEYDRSFLHLSPFAAAITSMDADHLDIYQDAKQMKSSGFSAFSKKIKKGGHLFLNAGLQLRKPINVSKRHYGVEQGDIQARNIKVKNGYFYFDYCDGKTVWKDLKFTLPGVHNVENAVAAISLARLVKVNEAAARKALASFKGIKRRFEFIIRKKALTYIDDYAHHPTELVAAIKAARMLYPERKLTGVFQPHLYSRTKDFKIGFAAALDLLDEAILIPIYPAREKPIKGVTSKSIFDLMKSKNKKIVAKEELIAFINNEKIDVLMTLGAGDIDTEVQGIKKALS
jgi:UDP-N-acetylmuramate--alanine ligase